MLSRMVFVIASLLLVLTGCGGSDPGGGTKTLYIEANAVSDGSANGTSLSVVIRSGSSNGNFVQDAQVTMIGDKGSNYTLDFAGIFGIGGYGKSGFAWEPGWRLKIVRGADRAEGYLSAPGLTTITNPTASTTYNHTDQQPLTVRWRDESGKSAQTVEVKLKNARYDQVRSEDRGAYDIPVGTWGQASSDEQLTVTRTNSVALAGGVDGSVFKASTTASVRFQVQ